jgi:hypothetical protein
MSGKITLVTPPDIYENSNKSVLFCHLSEKDQEIISRWLTQRNLSDNTNFYLYTGETDIGWLFYATGVCQYKYLDVDNMNNITATISSYILSKSDFFYKIQDENLAAIYNHINTNRINKIEQFLERVFSDQST